MSSRKNGIAMFSYRRMYRYFRVKKAKKELKGQTHFSGQPSWDESQKRSKGQLNFVGQST